ncbi:Membrane protein [Corynebacterium pseudotuberculosis]|uniref:hypothetical protein n=1 Tax=Corynebacterium pseudotuberculosis TaxID=1719 RepID=UPI000C1CC34E|nr:hypothetical protein [Corynebacterium pseudotuberculosis]ATV80263.1 Membrane protein [Corynebacterium pseudotuberculosis]
MRYLHKARICSGIIASSLIIGALPATAYATPVETSLSCSIDAGRYGKTVQETKTTFNVTLPEKVTKEETFTAKVKLSDVSLHNNSLNRVGSVKMEKSTININVGNNVKLAEAQPGVTLSNGILTLSNKLVASISHGTAHHLSAGTLAINSRPPGVTLWSSKTTKDATSGTVRAYMFIFSATATSSCTTKPDVQLASAKVTPKG